MLSVATALVSRAQRSTFSAFTRVFDALWWCAADPGPSFLKATGVPDQRRTVPLRFTLHRVRDTGRES
ncbi:MAG: hypothetical protein QOF09_4973 [Alphaproteobacteria bacterium]|jgi:hypothetical protein|nr:hypothetical protein [Alphaproteobacteria bacterium]